MRSKTTVGRAAMGPDVNTGVHHRKLNLEEKIMLWFKGLFLVLPEIGSLQVQL